MKKSKFRQSEIEVLGCIVNKDEIKVNLRSLDVEKIFKPPTNIKGVQRILGTINWYRNFVPNSSTKGVKGITDLLRCDDKCKKFKWTVEHNDELRNVVNKIKENIIIKCPNFDKVYYLETDASVHGIGGVLTQ